MAEPSYLTQLFPFSEVSLLQAQQLMPIVQALVSDDLVIESTQVGRDQRKEGVVIVRGRLLRPSHEVFSDWLTALKAQGYTPILRHDPDGREGYVVLRVMAGTPQRIQSKPWLNLLLFLLTLASTMLAGLNYADGLQLNDLSELFYPRNWIQGWPFAVALLSILLAHEFGHYFASRYHRLAVSLPFFIPLPIPGAFSPGTMGAFIRLKELVPDRRKLFDIGVAGPLAGLIVAIPILFWGVVTAKVAVTPPGSSYIIEGNSLLYLLTKWLFHGKYLPNSVTGEDLFLNALTAAAWFGLLITAINLLPVGQLDGGHTIYALLGDRAQPINRWVMRIMLLLGIFSLIPPLPSVPSWLNQVFAYGYSGWLLWFLLINFVIGPHHPPPLDDVTELDKKRRWIGYLVLVIFVLTFVPVPERFVGM